MLPFEWHSSIAFSMLEIETTNFPYLLLDFMLFGIVLRQCHAVTCETFETFGLWGIFFNL